MEGKEEEEKPFKPLYHKSLVLKFPGLRFFTEVSKNSIIRTEIENPFENMQLYELDDVDIKPLDVSKIPPEAWPYPTCFFVSGNLTVSL